MSFELSADPSGYQVVLEIEPEYEGLLDAGKLHRLALSVLQEEGVQGPVELGILVTTDDEVHSLNREYLGHDYKTDVISFGMQEEAPSPGKPRFVTPAEQPIHLGDVVISYDRATEQAPEYAHSADAEVALLLIHGILHLLGYDDTNDAHRAMMHARQQELLATLYG